MWWWLCTELPSSFTYCLLIVWTLSNWSDVSLYTYGVHTGTTVLYWYEGLVYGNLAGNPKWDIHAYASHRTIVIYAWIRRLMGAVLSVEKILEMLTKTLQPGEIPSKLPSSFFTAIACFGYVTNLYWFAWHCSWHPGPRDKAWILAAHWNRGMGAWEQIQLVAPFSCAVPWTRLVQNTEFP